MMKFKFKQRYIMINRIFHNFYPGIFNLIFINIEFSQRLIHFQ